VAISDLLLAPFTPSNTARSGGTIFPIVKHIPSLYNSPPEKEPRKIGAYIAWVGIASTCVTSSMFSTAMATNLLGNSLVEDLGMVSPSWGEWFLYFLPVGLILIILVPLLTYIVYPPQLKTSETIPLWAFEELKRLGRISRKERIMAMLSSLALILWIFGKYFDINATVSALAVLCLMVLFGILDWNDIISNKAAWNVFLWFGALVTLAGGLNNVGFLSWFATRITSSMSSCSPFLILLFLLLVFFFSHYLFASATAHATALTTLFLSTARDIPGVNLPLLTYLLLFTFGIMGILTPYATGPSPIWYGFGYIKTGTFWKLGALFGALFILVLIIVGIPWIKLWL
jgi:anion transporter